MKRASTDASITRSWGANSVVAAPPTSATARIIMAFGMGVGWELSMPWSASSTGTGVPSPSADA